MAHITLSDPALGGYALTERVKKLKKAYFEAMPEICVERPVLVTKYSRENGYFSKDRITVLEKARLYRDVLEKRAPVVRQREAYKKGKDGGGPKKFSIGADSLFAGSTTTKFKGVPLYPEFMAMMLWPELWNISRRKSNPFYLSGGDAETLNFEVFPYWIENNINELARNKCYEKTGSKSAPEMELLELLVFFIDTKPNCISHTIPDFSKAVNKGLAWIISEAGEKRAKCTDDTGREFYDALVEVLEGIISYSKRIADEAQRLAATETDPRQKQELLDLAGIHRRVPKGPATTFREGLTTFWLCWTALHVENPNVAISLGRLDQLLYGLYRKDIDSGKMDVKGAIELLCCLWLKIGDHVPCIPEAGEKLFGGSGSNQAITIGGVDKNGNDAVNDLTYVILRAIELMQLRDPNLNARYYPGVNDEGYLRRLCEVNLNTGATPALHNDRAVIAALTACGDSVEHARDYGVIGCVEPVSAGRTYGHTGAVMLNLTTALELTLFQGRHRHTRLDRRFNDLTGDPSAFATFEEFRNAFIKQATWLTERAVSLNNIYGQTHQRFYPTPVMSAFFEGPMESGKDVIEGGARINSSGSTIVGLADVADCLSAIEDVVYKKKKYTINDILAAITGDFKDKEVIKRCLLDAPKYGNEEEAADKNVAYIISRMEEIFGRMDNYRGGKYRVGYWTMTNHAGFGRMMGATPNGRMARDNFTSGITPVSGVTPSLTKTLNSVAGVPVEDVTSGMAFNIKFTPEDNKASMLDNFTAYVKSYFDDRTDKEGNKRPGGMEIQFNVTNHKEFMDAFVHPENYPELLVRVSGYTAYFKDLNPQMQMEIINRTEYNLANSRAVPYEPFKLPKNQACPA